MRVVLPYRLLYAVRKTIRASGEYYVWIKAYNRDGEMMKETLRRLTREPD